MSNLSESPYFFYGSADYNEFSEIKSQYALYDPISERFVLTSKFSHVLHTVSLLWSGRLSLRLCSLHNAKNFRDDLVDNTCCTNWSLKNKEDILIARPISTHITQEVYKVHEIVPSENLIDDELILENREYLMATYHWISPAESGKAVYFNKSDHFYRTEFELQGLIDLPIELTPSAKMLRQIHNIIFAEPEFSIAKEKIESLIAGFEGIQE